MITFTIDGQSITVPKGTTVYTAAKQLGIDIPIFCYQDRMPPFGACRVCLVEVEKMPKPQTSCTLEATEGMVVKTQSALATEGRKNILEFLLINHPLDCPVCDRGGECPLQDQTLKFGPGISRFYEEKRHFKKPLPLGPVLMLDRERCIICARCTRFSDIISGDHALEMKERGFRTEVGTPDNGPADSKFIGNTIMICPVGALTSRVYRFRARPWDNTPTPSTCTLCPVGCSFTLDSRDGEIMRTRSTLNPAINDIWLCDKGWFGYEFAYHPNRLRTPLVRKEGELQEVSWKEAFDAIFHGLQKAEKRAGIGGNPLTVEENYLFQKLIRECLKSEHLDHRVGSPVPTLEEEGLAPGMETSLGDCENLSAALLLGLDVTEEFPLLWLRLKTAINKKIPLTFLGHFKPEIASYFSETILHAPGEEISHLEQHLDHFSQLQGPLGIFVGRQYLASPSRRAILAKLIKFRSQNPQVNIHILEGRGNSQGARFAGMHPELGPMGNLRENAGLNTIEMLKKAGESGWGYLHVAGADPAGKLPKDLWKKAREGIQTLVVQDLFLTETAKSADIVLPTLCFLEKEGHFINISSDLQRLQPGKDLPDNIYSDGEIFKKIAERFNFPLEMDDLFIERLLTEGARRPNHSQELSEENVTPPSNPEGTLSATFSRSLFDDGVRMRHNTRLHKLVKAPYARMHPNEAANRNIAEGAILRLGLHETTIEALVALDEGVALGTLVLPLGFESLHTKDLTPYQLNGEPITVIPH